MKFSNVLDKIKNFVSPPTCYFCGARLNQEPGFKDYFCNKCPIKITHVFLFKGANKLLFISGIKNTYAFALYLDNNCLTIFQKNPNPNVFSVIYETTYSKVPNLQEILNIMNKVSKLKVFL